MAFLRKSERDSGLGISLEGTVDVEEGQEVRPHHYIRSILPGGPVGRERTLQPGDELLQVGPLVGFCTQSYSPISHHRWGRSIKYIHTHVCGRCVTRAYVLIGCSLAQLPFGRLSATLELSYRVTLLLT